jgi:hypothetical protein
MTAIFSKVWAIAAAVLITTGVAGTALAQSTPPAGAGGGGPPAGYSAPDASGGPAGPAGDTRPLDVPLLYVTGVEVLQTTIDPKLEVIRVTGLASSQGWSNPTLVPFFYGKSADDILDLQFIGTSPEQSQKAEGFVPMSAVFEVEAGLAIKGVRVRAAGNALEVTSVPGVAKADIKIDDCKECIGKTFVEKGKGQAGPGVVYAGDLPPDYRPIAPTHGVKGEVHSPNRINLILDSQNKIVMAFWE